MKIYSRDPLYIKEEIPIFSESNDYTENYEKIAVDAISMIQETGQNQWIQEDLWLELEGSTADLIKKYSKPGDTILDIGVGFGRLLDWFPHMQRFGLDISLELLKKARTKGIEVCYSQIEDMPYNPDIFDIIVCTDVLEHVKDLNFCCQKILESLKPEGFLIIRTPYKEDLKPYLSPGYPYKYAHLRTFDETTFHFLFTRILPDCNVIEITFVGYRGVYGGSTPESLPTPDRIKYPVSPLLEFFFNSPKLMKLLKKVHPKKYRSLLSEMYLPIEMNVVVQKKKNPC